jgi:hypothetical protein
MALSQDLKPDPEDNSAYSSDRPGCNPQICDELFARRASQSLFRDAKNR